VLYASVIAAKTMRC